MKHSVAVPEAILAANREGDRGLWVPNPTFTGVMGSFTAMTPFIAGMNRFITGPVRFMTGLMGLALTKDAHCASVGEPAMQSDTDQPCETPFISSRAAAITRFGFPSTRSLGDSPPK